jgi:hypothetical protein
MAAASAIALRARVALLPSTGDRHMARKPNYSFERQERNRIKANKVAEKANAKRDQRERERAESSTERDGSAASAEDQ